MVAAMDDAEKIAAGLTEAQRTACIEGRVRDCIYNHPIGTKCPVCSDWPFAKGGAAAFVETVRAILERPRS
jgi:hypothetical protein